MTQGNDQRYSVKEKKGIKQTGKGDKIMGKDLSLSLKGGVNGQGGMYRYHS